MFSTMRRCLQCPGILRNICEQAYEGGYDPDCRAAVAALNATCRSFHTVAEKVLYQRQFSLRPLVKHMPRDVWQDDAQTAMVSGTIVSRPRPAAPPDALSPPPAAAPLRRPCAARQTRRTGRRSPPRRRSSRPSNGSGSRRTSTTTRTARCASTVRARDRSSRTCRSSCGRSPTRTCSSTGTSSLAPS